jgi:hypothetical protein
MMMILKLIGLAFERASVLEKLQENEKLQNDFEKKLENISSSDIFHYCFNYIGLLVGEYIINYQNIIKVNCRLTVLHF